MSKPIESAAIQTAPESLRQETPPDWTVVPKREEIVLPDGRPTFHMVRCIDIPEVLGNPKDIRLFHVALAASTRRYEPSLELQAQKEALVQERKKMLEEDYQKRLKTWNSGGRQDNEPVRKPFFDAPQVRVLPQESFTTVDPDGNSILVLRVGSGDVPVTYFDYVAGRERDPKRFNEKELPMPLGICGVLVAKDRNDRRFLVYTVREATESYSQYLHVVGGMMKRPQLDMPDPVIAWLQELLEEGGMRKEEIIVDGCIGIGVDAHFVHPELMFQAHLDEDVMLEDIFSWKEDGVGLKRLRPAKDKKEVTFRAIPFEPEFVQALALGEKIKGGDQDPRPFVPTGLAAILEAGRLEFGQEWHDETMMRYQARIALVK